MNKVWRKCDVCKKDLLEGSVYQKCAVSTCNKRAFCSVTCFDQHVPVMNHKDAWCEEMRVPKLVVGVSAARGVPTNEINASDDDVLIVASKLKSFVKTRFDLSTSQSVIDKLSDMVRAIVHEGSFEARKEGRKTLMDRDLTFPK